MRQHYQRHCPVLFLICSACIAIHDHGHTVEAAARLFRVAEGGADRLLPSSSPRERRQWQPQTSGEGDGCSGGLCVGMHGGPHEHGRAAYPVFASGGYTKLSSKMTVPEYPLEQDSITYYIWTDIFFGASGFGRMNQFVPQLILGRALDGSSGPPEYHPKYGTHESWMFGAHYFFEVENVTTGKVEAKAAYGRMFPALVGEELFTNFTLNKESGRLVWTLVMGASNDESRISVLKVPAPYMGIGAKWPEGNRTVSWGEPLYENMFINACWELYGAVDRHHMPSSGTEFEIRIEKPTEDAYPWVTQWDQDEGANRSCATSAILESNSPHVQKILWTIQNENKQFSQAAKK